MIGVRNNKVTPEWLNGGSIPPQGTIWTIVSEQQLNFMIMITLKNIRELEFSSMEEFFAYVEESYINGNKKAAYAYIDKMSKNQKRLFVRFLTECPLTVRALYDHTLNKL